MHCVWSKIVFWFCLKDCLASRNVILKIKFGYGKDFWIRKDCIQLIFYDLGKVICRDWLPVTFLAWFLFRMLCDLVYSLLLEVMFTSLLYFYHLLGFVVVLVVLEKLVICWVLITCVMQFLSISSFDSVKTC